MNKSNPSTYYVNIPKYILDTTDVLIRFFGGITLEVRLPIMNVYFSKYWPEFVKFWSQSGEVPEWNTFALVPHNAHWFILYVFKKHKDVYDLVYNDMKDAGVFDTIAFFRKDDE